MSALTRPRHRLVEVAINLARQWCYGHVIDGSPALGHALKVARKVDEHLSTASPDLIAAVILHDAPYFAPDSDDLEQLLTGQLSADVARIVWAIKQEHDALDDDVSPRINLDQPDVVVASAADKVISIGAVLRRAERHTMPITFWLTRQPFVDRVPYFYEFMMAAWPYLPNRLAWELQAVIEAAQHATQTA